MNTFLEVRSRPISPCDLPCSPWMAITGHVKSAAWLRPSDHNDHTPDDARNPIRSQVFDDVDSDDDGSITLEEFITAVGMLKKSVLEVTSPRDLP